MRSIGSGSNFRIRSSWIKAHTYSLSFHSFFFFRIGEGGQDRRREKCIFVGKVGARFEVVH